MRICFISRRFFPAISGMSVYALNLLRQLVRAGHDIVMISQYRNDAAGSSVYGGGPPPEVPGVEVIGLESLGEQRVNSGLPADFEADLRAMVRAALEAHERKPFDVVHAQYGYPNGLAALEVSRRTGVPNVVSIQGGDGHWVGTCCDTHARTMRAVLNHAGAVLIGSRSFAEEVAENHGTDIQRFTIVPGATDTERFRPRDPDNLGGLSSPPTLLYHGRVDLRKGLGELLKAFRSLANRHPTLRLTVSGIGPDLETVRTQVTEESLEGRVCLTGYTAYEDAPRVYHKGDIFVSPTYSEGFSNTILEAMASGLPVVSTDTVGVVDCLTDGHNGLLVPVRDSEALAGAIDAMLRDDSMRTRLARQSLADVCQLYSWPAVSAQIERAYHNVAGNTPDCGWTTTYRPDSTLEDADPNCRFRSQPHFL